MSSRLTVSRWWQHFPPVSFVYNDDASSTVRYGFIAEDTATVDSHLATYDASGAISGVDDRGLLAIIVSAIQQIEKAISDLADHFTTKELTFTRAMGDELDVQKALHWKHMRDRAATTSDARERKSDRRACAHHIAAARGLDREQHEHRDLNARNCDELNPRRRIPLNHSRQQPEQHNRRSRSPSPSLNNAA
jgi:hypothetical protein